MIQDTEVVQLQAQWAQQQQVNTELVQAIVASQEEALQIQLAIAELSVAVATSMEVQ